MNAFKKLFALLLLAMISTSALALPAGYVSQGGLTWMPVSNTVHTYAQATALCAGTINGQTGWRLPTLTELSGLTTPLTTYTATGGLYGSGAMNGQGWALNYTWSSTPGSGSAGTHYIVILVNGNVGGGRDTDNFAVTCVTNASSTPTNSYALTVAQSGNGSGTVTSADSSINCGSSCSASYTSGTSVTLTATPAARSTFAGWGGACTGTGICTLSMNAAANVTATFNTVPFPVVTTGVTDGIITAAPNVTVTTTVTINPADALKLEDVFVTAWVPSGTLTAAQQAKIASYTTLVKPMGATAASTTFVLVQLTQSGWQPVVNGKLIPYVSNVLGDQAAAISILNNTDTTKLGGSQFCVGYGTSASDMTAAGRMQLIATVSNPNANSANTGSCNVALPISDARVFSFAVANYSGLFAGTATGGQITYQGNSYDYRYYPTYKNYLAVDTSGVVWILGSVSGGKIQFVGPVETFRNVITTWEGTQ